MKLCGQFRTFVLTILLSSAAAARGAYNLEVLATGLQQPTYVTQAPGDNGSVYFVERTSTNGGTDGNFRLGKIFKLDLTTKQKSLFLDFSSSNGTNQVSNDAGLLCMTFHPDFQTNGKFYVTMAADPTPVSNRLLEYKMVGGVPTFQRTVLQYGGNLGSFHTVDWIGFKPNSTGDERNHLYVTTGDGGPVSSNPAYVAKSQDLNQIYGKLLRIDISDGADAYPADANKNFGIPAINTYPGAPPKLGEVIASGFRNPFRASFDRANGDLYIGDVGFNTQEEIDFIRHESISPLSAALGVQDFGWARREGVIQNPDSLPGVGGPKGSSIDPILFRTASASDDGVRDDSITGGYVYRGPIPELQGRYIFADYVGGRVYSVLFDRNTDPTTFNGLNTTDFQDMTALWESLILGGGDLARISSFGEDNLGNLYLVSLAAPNSANPYNSVGEGTIYRLIVPEPSSLATLLLVAPLLTRRRRPRGGVGRRVAPA